MRSHKDYIELFDSLGIDEEKHSLITNYCKFRTKKIIFNEDQFQDSTSDSCGYFVLYFVFERMHNLDLSFEDLLEDIFNHNHIENEEKVKQFCEEILTKLS